MPLSVDSLKRLKIWVLWKSIDGRKLPFQPGGAVVKANDSSTWHTYQEVRDAYDEDPERWSGIGTEFCDPFVGIDLDFKTFPGAKPFDYETFPQYAKDIVRQQDSYTEFSPSGLGLHILCYRPSGSPAFTIKNHEAGVEVYTEGRYFAYTGKRVPGTREEFTLYNSALFSKYGRYGRTEKPAPELERSTGSTGSAAPISVGLTRVSEGGRNDALFKRGSAYRGEGDSEEVILARLLQDNEKLCDPPLDRREIENIARSCMKFPEGIRESRGGGGGDKPVSEAKKRLIYRWGDKIKEEPLEFFWDPVLPMASLTHFGGPSSAGKSPVTVDLAARITTGAPWPDGKPNIYGPRSVIMLNVEDRAEDTILPRFLLAGGDRSRLCIVEGTRFEDDKGTELERMLALDSDMALLTELAESIPDLGLISADPVTNYLGRQRMNNEAEVRSVLTPYAKLAQRLRVCAITVGHHNKSDSKDPLQKMMGAAAFVGVARAVWSFGNDPDGETPYCRMMAPARGNIGDQAMKYRTTVNEARTVSIVWNGWGEGSAEDTVTHVTREDRGKADDAADALKEFLSAGPRSSIDCKKMLKEMGVSNMTRVRRKAGVASSEKGPGINTKDAVWRMEGQGIQEPLLIGTLDKSSKPDPF